MLCDDFTDALKTVKVFVLKCTYLGKPQKKFFFSGPATKALTPPPLELGGHRNFFFFLVLNC